MRTPHTVTRRISTAASSQEPTAASHGKHFTADTDTTGHPASTASDSAHFTQFLATGAGEIPYNIQRDTHYTPMVAAHPTL